MILEELAECRIVGNNVGRVEVCVFCITYNQCQYIKDAIEGLLMQKTNYKYKIIVYDDASTDGTTEIVEAYASKYPDLICAYIARNNTFRHPLRRYMWNNFQTRVAASKYVAICEGDDYWIDENKLQVQYDYMNSDEECVLLLHNAIWEDCHTKEKHDANPFEATSTRQITDEEAIMLYNAHPPTASFFFQSKLLELPNYVLNAPMGDYSLMLYALTRGKIHYMPRIMSVYRYLAANSYSLLMRSDELKTIYFNYNALVFLVNYDSYSDYKYHRWCLLREQMYAYALLDKMHFYGGVSKSLYECEKRGFTLCQNQEVMEKLEEIYNLIYTDGINCSVECFVSRYKKIYVMGTGNYAYILSQKFEINALAFDSYVVSVKSDQDFFRGKRVRELKELKDEKDYGVIVAIRPTIWGELYQTLKDNNIKNFYSPYLFDVTGKYENKE